ncbi:MAG: alanine racemase [Tenericutes bacterium HGW-Tenericutes-6]|jgi:alanine racemase|nr:MAG: alanine racemase [Tenericutes bacterium HGW-Tenericutes-6]
MSKFYRPSWAEIRLDHILHNYRIATKHREDKTIIPVIKANAYGHGDIEVMKYLKKHGVMIFAISLLEEGIRLRKKDQDIEILMLGPIQKNELKIASKFKIDITIYDEAILESILSTSYPLNCHLKIDTGMSRYGLSNELTIHQAVLRMSNHQTAVLKGIYTHFATANDQNEHYFMQLKTMQNLIGTLKFKPPMIHMSNSASIFYQEQHLKETTHARLGISLYGHTLDDLNIDLKEAMVLKSKIVTIKTLKKGDKVGYGATYEAKENQEKIAIIPIGYADGFLRKNKHGYVEIHGKRYKLVGIICMDACFIKIDDTIKVGDVVTLFGGLIKTSEVAKRCQTIPYEILTSISYRIPRIYIEGGIYD